MDRQWKWRALGLVGLVVVSILMLVPTLVDTYAEPEAEAEDGQVLPEWFTDVFSNRLILGLDLQGGIHLQYKVDIEEALGRRAVQSAANIEILMKQEHGLDVTATPGEEGGDLDQITSLTVKFPSAGDAEKLDEEFLNKNAPDYQIADVEGDTVRLVMGDDAIDAFRESALNQAIDTIERRVNEFGVAESTITKRGDDQLVVQLPGVDEEDFGEAKEKLAQTGQLHFQIVDREGAPAFFQKIAPRNPLTGEWPEGLDPALKNHKVYAGQGVVRSTSRKLLEHMVEGQTDAEHIVGYEEIFVDPTDPTLSPITTLSEEQEQLLRRTAVFDPDASVVEAYELNYLFRKAGMSGENVEDASVGYDQFNRPVVHMRFSQVDADKFYEMTKQYTQELMAIMIDEIVFSAPRIKEPIGGGRVQIEMGAVGRQAFKEASALVAVLKSGALQAPLRKLYDSQVGPTLGADSVQAGKLSVIVGFLAVIIFMVVYYKVAGLVANVALVLNLLFVMAGLTAFGATLTLPGIAGIVLTVGMAVDANVLIFERIREELRMGVTVRKAIDAGYEKAFSAIVDANVTTGIAAIVLYQFGSGPIRGFAVTLGIGIVCSMYTALLVTRLIFNYAYGRGTEPARMSI